MNIRRLVHTMALSAALLPCTFPAMPAAAFAAAPAAAEWPQWRGPRRDGISTETGLLKEWKSGGPPLLWQGSGLGGGFSSVAISGGKIFTMGQHGKDAFLIALALEGGKKLWSTKVGEGEPNSTPTVDGDLVFALGREGDLTCSETATGNEVWRKSLGKDFGGSMMSGWGYSESPLVDGDRLICSPGGKDALIVALEKKTGNPIWKAASPKSAGDHGNDGAAYSSIVVSEACGVRQYVQLVGRGLVSVAAKDGKLLWTYNKIANGTANIPTPLVKDDYVFCSSGYGGGAALLRLVKQDAGVKAEEVYFLPADKMQNHHGGMVLVGDHVYCGHGQNEGFPICVELKTGNIAWKPGRGPGEGSAAVVYADGQLYFRYQSGIMALIDATPEKYVLRSTFKIATHNGESWPHPVIADGRLYLRDQDALLCYGLRD